MSAARKSSAYEAKQRRQKKIAIGGGIVLVLLLAVQGPKTLKALRGSSGAAPAVQPAAVAPAVPGVSAVAAPATSLRELGNFDAPQKAGPGQLVAFNRFAARDPFVPGSEYRDPGLERGRSRTVQRPVVQSRPRDGRFPLIRRNVYTVVLASVPLRAGRKAAESRARAIRTELGLPSVGVLVSSDYRSLRPDYFVVYVGRYETRTAARRALPGLRAKGARRAYTVYVSR